MRIFHLLDPQAWSAARSAGSHRPASLESEGFVHFSFAQQVAASADRHLGDAEELVAVEFEADDLAACLRIEDSYGSGTQFPHVYAALPTDLARAVHPMHRNAEGGWVFSPGGADAAASPDR